MFTKSASFYDALYHFKDYPAASAQLHALLQQVHPSATTLLDVGCGTGKHLETLQTYYKVEGLDLDPDLLAVARERCPDVALFNASMVDFELDHTFDVITCLFSSIGYVKTIENLHQAVSTMAAHLKEGGILVIEPWFSPEQYWVGRLTANHFDEPDLKITWMYVSERKDDISIFKIHYLVGTPEGVEHYTERHEMGLFADVQYRAAFQNAGLTVSYDSEGLFGRGMYVGAKGGLEKVDIAKQLEAFRGRL